MLPYRADLNRHRRRPVQNQIRISPGETIAFEVSIWRAGEGGKGRRARRRRRRASFRCLVAQQQSDWLPPLREEEEEAIADFDLRSLSLSLSLATHLRSICLMAAQKKEEDV